MDWSFIAEYTPLFAESALLTIIIGGIGTLLSMMTGLICALIKYFRIPVLKHIVTAYTELSRNTPLIVQLFFLYFGLPKAGIVLSSEACGIIGLTFLGGSYMAESFYAALGTVLKGQIDSADSLALNRVQTMRYVVFPQAARAAVSPICANVIFLLKETSVFSAVSLADLMYTAKDLIGMYYNTTEILSMLVVSYLLILLPVSGIFSLLERRINRGRI